MVQAEPNLTLTLKHLSPLGVMLSTEQQAALDYSLPIKRVETGLKSLTLWGKISVLNGKDYLIAEGVTDASIAGPAVSIEAKYCYSQDGVKWVDLQAVAPEVAQRAARVKGPLSGDASKSYELEELPEPGAPPPPVPEEGAEVTKRMVTLLELAVLRARVDAINAATGVVPSGSHTNDATNHIIVHKLFSGCPYPEKLESYAHRTVAPGGPTLAQDLRGSWAVHHDPFRATYIVRSLIWPGYFFYYKADELTWGGMYVGDGVRNNDLIFML